VQLVTCYNLYDPPSEKSIQDVYSVISRETLSVDGKRVYFSNQRQKYEATTSSRADVYDNTAAAVECKCAHKPPVYLITQRIDK